MNHIRNFSIIAHIDHGKSTLADRLIQRCGGLEERQMEAQVLDSMDIEKERGITITSAAVTIEWKNTLIQLIDTPGHVDFTIEVERSLRVLDGAVLVLCGVSGVQSQSFTVDRQMRRYGVPCLAFINKLDRSGANPFKVKEQLKAKLGHNPVLMQIPIGLEDDFGGLVDLIKMKAMYFDGRNGEHIREEEIPANLLEQAKESPPRQDPRRAPHQRAVWG